MQRRIAEAIIGLILIMIALMTGIDQPPLALVIGLIGLALLWHQHQLGESSRQIRPARAERAAHGRSWRGGRREREQRISQQVAGALKAAVSTASQRGIEAGLEELGRQIERAVTPGSAAPTEAARPRRTQLVELGSDEAYAHAVDAARAAGLELSRTAVIPVDVGLIVYNAAGERSVHRTTPVETDAAFVQPFVQLNMPTRAIGRLRYELIDSDGQAVFIHEDDQTLARGVNLLTPTARLRTHSGLARYGHWRLVISADGVRLLDHTFGWYEDARARLRRHLVEDGELTSEARSLLDGEIGGPGMSLDDLIGAQDDNAARSARR